MPWDIDIQNNMSKRLKKLKILFVLKYDAWRVRFRLLKRNMILIKRILYMLDNIDTNYVTVTNSDVNLFKDSNITTPIELYNDFKN